MAANNALQLSSINFDGIKDNLKTFLQNQTELEDYDYESSTMQILLNLLAYNTYMNSYYLNMVANESFLDSAQLRNNVVSRAKMLGYTPRSARGTAATVQLVITPTDSPSSITIDKNKKFRAAIDGVNYIFVNPEAKVINADSQGIFSTNIDLVEGRPLTHKYTVSTVNPVKYVIPNENVDLDSLVVTVQESAEDSSVITYTEGSDLTNVTGDSYVYFIDENIDGKYELKFGDNILGRQLNDGQVINIDYRVCNGEATRGASIFTAVDTIDGYSTIAVNTVSAAQSGGSRETIQSIKFNAPKNYQTQNRAVTRKDYQALITNFFTDIQAVSVWGGEDNNPPIYGKVYISLKPREALLLADDRKRRIKDYLLEKSVLTIEPEVVDPSYLYVKPALTVKYNPELTSLTSGQLNDAISNAIINYETNKIGLFDQDYIESELTRDIYTVSSAITSIQIDTMMEKTFTPNTSAATTYRIPFNNEIHNYEDTTKPFNISSSKFTYDGNSNSYFDDDGLGNIRVYTPTTTGERTYLNSTAGTVTYSTGLIILNSLLITDYDGAEVRITADPDKEDISPVRNQLLLIKDASIDLFNTKLKKTVATISSINTEGVTTSIAEDGVLTTVY